jgi:hypothetical protein
MFSDIMIGGFMKLEKRKLSGREKDEASINLLGQLREKLYCDNISVARCAAFNLSWMQEDGFDILKEALFGDSLKTTKTAAAYGLRSMHGRMKKMALKVFEQGLKHRDGSTRWVCKKSLSLIKARTAGKSSSKGKKAQVGKFEIREIPSKSGQKGKIHEKTNEEHLLPEQDSFQE